MDSIEYEALRRAQEMQRGSNNHSQSRNNPKASAQSSHNGTAQKTGTPQQESPRKSHKQKTSEETQSTQSNHGNHSNHNNQSNQNSSPTPQLNLQGNLAENLFEDKEKLLILALILILSDEKSQDPALILALLYLII